MKQVQIKPIVSVIIGVFNGERLIREALQSLLHQTRQPLEIIVVDDGSTDHTEDIIRNYSSPIPIAYHRQENQGAAVAQ
jgi:glycosyltransferase involved in cell wall biosynthesis